MAKLEHVTTADVAEYAQQVGMMGFSDYYGYGNGEFVSDEWEARADGRTWDEWDATALKAIVNDDREALLKAIEGMDRTYWKMRCPAECEQGS